jgi:hypothetical protein
MIRTWALLITCLGAVPQAATAEPASTSGPLGIDQRAIMQAVLDDARRNWHQGDIPCLSDTLESATSSEATKHRISTSLRSPFPFCRERTGSKRHLALHEAIIRAGDALISLDYVCPLCGNGTVYSLRKVGGSWRIVSRTRGWVS